MGHYYGFNSKACVTRAPEKEKQREREEIFRTRKTVVEQSKIEFTNGIILPPLWVMKTTSERSTSWMPKQGISLKAARKSFVSQSQARLLHISIYNVLKITFVMK